MSERSSSRLPFATDETAQALGHFCIAWNLLEFTIQEMTQRYSKESVEIVEAIHGALTNQSRINLLKKIVAAREPRSEARETLEYIFKCYAVLAENRNILMHGIVHWESDNPPTMLRKMSKTNIGKWVYFRYDETVFKECAAAAEDVLLFAKRYFVCDVINQIDILENLTGQRPHPEGWKPLALPERPPLPSKLNPLPPEARQGDLAPPPASGA